MSLFSSLIVALQLMFCSAVSQDTRRPYFWLECHQIGDNLYNCDGGHQ